MDTFLGIILILLAMGFILFTASLVSLRRSKDSFFWPYTNGRILSAKITVSEQNQGRSDQPRYVPEIKYTYRVQGSDYTGSRLQIMNDFSSFSLEAVKKVIVKYRPGSEVVVYYEPGRPKRSVLVKGISNGIYVMMGFASVLLLAALVLLLKT